MPSLFKNALPNLVATALLLYALASAFSFLREALKPRVNASDYGLRIHMYLRSNLSLKPRSPHSQRSWNSQLPVKLDTNFHSVVLGSIFEDCQFSCGDITSSSHTVTVGFRDYGWMSGSLSSCCSCHRRIFACPQSGSCET